MTATQVDTGPQPRFVVTHQGASRCVHVELLFVFHVRPASRSEVDPRKGVLDELNKLVARSLEVRSATLPGWFSEESRELAVEAFEVLGTDTSLSDLEELGPYSHVVCDVRIRPVNSALPAPGLLEQQREALLHLVGQAIAPLEYQARSVEVRFTRRLNSLEQGVLQSA